MSSGSRFPLLDAFQERFLPRRIQQNSSSTDRENSSAASDPASTPEDGRNSSTPSDTTTPPENNRRNSSRGSFVNPQTPPNPMNILAKRAIGFCDSLDCADYNKPIFLINHEKHFYCPNCTQKGFIEPESGSYIGQETHYKEVRVQFNFDPLTRSYRETAIVTDESLTGGNTYYLNTPLVSTQNRALKIAEAILSNLNRFGLDKNDIPRPSGTTLNFDASREEFFESCQVLGKELAGSALSRNRKE